MLQSAGLPFAAFARVAMGEVRDPARTIPQAVHFAFGSTVAAHAVVVLSVLGPHGLAALPAPAVVAGVAVLGRWDGVPARAPASSRPWRRLAPARQ